MLYIYHEDRIGGDGFEVAFSVDLDAIRATAESHKAHLTERELAKTDRYITGYRQFASKAEYYAALDEMLDLPLPDFCELCK